MELKSTPISDVYVLHKPVRKDIRGQFCRLYGADELSQAGLSIDAIHVNSSTSTHAGTLRGIHFQYPPFAETKIVSCASGSLWDVAIDLRPNSPTRFQSFGIELNPGNGLSLIVPKGFGHAFLTLEPNTTAIYVVSTVYSLKHESGAMYNDSLLSIDWPINPSIFSEKDQCWSPLEKRLAELDSGFQSLH